MVSFWRTVSMRVSLLFLRRYYPDQVRTRPNGCVQRSTRSALALSALTSSRVVFQGRYAHGAPLSRSAVERIVRQLHRDLDGARWRVRIAAGEVAVERD